MNKGYAKIDRFYSVFDGEKTIFKHIFRPHPKYGRNSTSEIVNSNNIIFPDRNTKLFDKTKSTYFIKKEEI